MNNSDLTSKYNNSSSGLFKDNTSGDIGANDARSLVVDIAASFINNETDFEKYVRQGTATGTDTYAVSVSSANNIYSAANLYVVAFSSGSTGAVTLNVNSGGAKKVYVNPTTQAGSGDITANAAYLLRYYTTLDSGSGGFLMIGGPGGSGGGSQNLSSVLTQGNDAAGLNIVNLSGPSSAGDAATKGYVDGQVAGVTTNDLAAVLAQGNDADGTTITNLPTPSAGSDAATKTYVDGVASGSTQLADFTAVTDAAPLAADCNNLKEPKFYTSLANSRTIDLTNVRAVNNNNQYVTLFWIFKKTVSGDLVVTLDADSSFTNKDLATDASATSYTLSGASNTYFKLSGIFHGESSGCIVWWNLVTVTAVGSATWGALTGTITDQSDLVAYVTGLLDGLKWKNSVKVATTTNGTLATAYENGDTVDGVSLSTGDRILLKNQTTQTENGIYTVNASGAPTRASDANSAAELEGATVTVQQGTSNANTTWTQTTDGITLGSSNLVWAQFGTSVADADSTTKGIAKLYNTSGTNTDGAITQGAAKTADDLKLNLAGGTMTGAIAMSSNKITGLAAATGAGDALRFEQLPQFVIGEVPSGTINGSNTAFTIANTPIAGTVQVYFNGLRMKATSDYTISGTTITFGTAPVSGDTLITDYQK